MRCWFGIVHRVLHRTRGCIAVRSAVPTFLYIQLNAFLTQCSFTSTSHCPAVYLIRLPARPEVRESAPQAHVPSDVLACSRPLAHAGRWQRTQETECMQRGRRRNEDSMRCTRDRRERIQVSRSFLLIVNLRDLGRARILAVPQATSGPPYSGPAVCTFVLVIDSRRDQNENAFYTCHVLQRAPLTHVQCIHVRTQLLCRTSGSSRMDQMHRTVKISIDRMEAFLTPRF